VLSIGDTDDAYFCKYRMALQKQNQFILVVSLASLDVIIILSVQSVLVEDHDYVVWFCLVGPIFGFQFRCLESCILWL
jgi:hypothetical protein